MQRGIGVTVCAVGVTDIVEVNSVHVVVCNNLGNNIGNIIHHLGITRFKIPGSFVMGTKRTFAASCGNTTLFCHILVLAKWQSDEPGVQVHTTFVTFLNGKCQWVVPRVFTWDTGKKSREWLYIRRVYNIASYPCLQKHSIDVHRFERVENIHKFSLLDWYVRCTAHWCGGPIEIFDCGEPHGAVLVFWNNDILGRRKERQPQQEYSQDVFCNSHNTRLPEHFRQQHKNIAKILIFGVNIGYLFNYFVFLPYWHKETAHSVKYLSTTLIFCPTADILATAVFIY